MGRPPGKKPPNNAGRVNSRTKNKRCKDYNEKSKTLDERIADISKRIAAGKLTPESISRKVGGNSSQFSKRGGSMRKYRQRATTDRRKKQEGKFELAVMRSTIKTNWSSFTAREKKILDLLYGIKGRELPHIQVASELKISLEDLKKIESAALAKLKKK